MNGEARIAAAAGPLIRRSPGAVEVRRPARTDKAQRSSIMKVAIIGGGISGLGAAYALKDRADVTLFEQDDRLGGHANTVTVDYDGVLVDVDTGFIVYNSRNY